jgi:MFS family permease
VDPACWGWTAHSASQLVDVLTAWWLQFYGRRPIYICSFTFFFLFTIPCAFAQNIQTMLIARFLDGLAGSAFLSVAGGTVGDMFAKHVSLVLLICSSHASFLCAWY